MNLKNKISINSIIKSTHFINYLRVATSPQSTQTANAAMSTAATGKKLKSNLFLIIHF